MNPTELDMIKQEMLSYGIEGLTEDLVPLKDTLTIISSEHALALYKVLHAMRDWGKEHRKICIK